MGERRKRALIIGIGGQDGSHLAEFLLDRDYEVHGTHRRSSVPNLERIEHIRDRVTLHTADLADGASLFQAFIDVEPDELYALGALSHVKTSFEVPEYAADVTGVGCLRLLEIARRVKPSVRIYQAGSSEQFGCNPAVPTNEDSAFAPASPYAVSKCFAFWTVKNYRESYGLHASTGLLFNHEGPRRGVDFVTRKITMGLAAIVHGRADTLVLGNLDACRDWGWAPDFVRAMWMMLQQDEPSDYVIATGRTHSVRDFLDHAFDHVGLDWHDHVTTDPRYFRPVDPPVLLGDASKARRELGWEPEVSFAELVRLMVDSDLKG